MKIQGLLKIFLFCFFIGTAVLVPSGADCVFCNPNQPCASDLECPGNCRCYHPPYMMGVCGD